MLECELVTISLLTSPFADTPSFVRPDILEELVNLIIHEPGDDVDEKLKYK